MRGNDIISLRIDRRVNGEVISSAVRIPPNLFYQSDQLGRALLLEEAFSRILEALIKLEQQMDRKLTLST
jgi:hypothetical protein